MINKKVSRLLILCKLRWFFVAQTRTVKCSLLPTGKRIYKDVSYILCVWRLTDGAPHPDRHWHARAANLAYPSSVASRGAASMKHRARKKEPVHLNVNVIGRFPLPSLFDACENYLTHSVWNLSDSIAPVRNRLQCACAREQVPSSFNVASGQQRSEQISGRIHSVVSRKRERWYSFSRVVPETASHDDSARDERTFVCRSYALPLWKHKCFMVIICQNQT